MVGSIITKIIAKNPPTVLTAIGGLGYLGQVEGSGVLLGLGVILNILWLARGLV